LPSVWRATACITKQAPFKFFALFSLRVSLKHLGNDFSRRETIGCLLLSYVGFILHKSETDNFFKANDMASAGEMIAWILQAA